MSAETLLLLARLVYLGAIFGLALYMAIRFRDWLAIAVVIFGTVCVLAVLLYPILGR